MVRSRPLVVALAVALALLAGASATVVSATATGDGVPVASVADQSDDNNATLTTDDGGLTLRPAPNQTIRGETDLDPGSEVSVALQGSSFYVASTTTVEGDGTFAASFDLGDVSPGTTVGISVESNPPEGAEKELVSATASVECSGDCPSGTDGSDGDETTVDANETDLQSITEVAQGRVASVRVSFGDADALTVSIGGPAVNYVVNGTVRDEDGDGRATVLFDTGDAGTDAPTLGVIDAGERRVVEASTETSLDSPLAPAAYEVTLHPGANSTDEPVAVGQILVFEGTQSPDSSANTSIVTEGEELVLQPAPDRTIRGETDLEPGTNLSVRVEADSFISVTVATVTERGTFDATVDASSAAGEDVSVRVYRDDTLLTETEGRVACSDGCEPATTGTESTATTDVSNPDPGAPSGGDAPLLGGVGMLALGGVLAVAGIGVVLGLFRD